MPVQLLIADSNHLSTLGLSTLFEKQTGVELQGTVNSADALKGEIGKQKPDVILMDYTSDGFGIDAVLQTKSQRNSPRIVAITPEQSGITIVNALKAGVDSYIKKDCGLEEIIEAVMETGRGQQFFCGQIVETIRRENIDTEDLALAALSCEPVVLSPREKEVITLIAEGYTNAQVAEKLFLSSHTINTHRKNIMTKLGVNNTAAIVMYAVKTQLVSPNKFLFNANN